MFLVTLKGLLKLCNVRVWHHSNAQHLTQIMLQGNCNMQHLCLAHAWPAQDSHSSWNVLQAYRCGRMKERKGGSLPHCPFSFRNLLGTMGPASGELINLRLQVRK